MNRLPTRTMATLATALGIAIAMTIAVAGPATARIGVQSRQPAAATAGQPRPVDCPPPFWERLLESVTTSFESVGEPLSTLVESLTSTGQLSTRIRTLLPKEVVRFYDELTEEDRRVLLILAQKHNEFESEDQALEALKEKSEKLYTKAAELHDLLKSKVDALNAEAKAFVVHTVEKLRALRPHGDLRPEPADIRRLVRDLIETYRALSDEAKDSLKIEFPTLTKLAWGIR